MRCVFCDEPAVSYHRFQEELPPQPDEFGDLWRTFRLVGDIFGFCARHAQRFSRYQFYVRETYRPDQDQALGDGRYRTPSGRVYRVLEVAGQAVVSDLTDGRGQT